MPSWTWAGTLGGLGFPVPPAWGDYCYPPQHPFLGEGWGKGWDWKKKSWTRYTVGRGYLHPGIPPLATPGYLFLKARAQGRGWEEGGRSPSLSLVQVPGTERTPGKAIGGSPWEEQCLGGIKQEGFLVVYG